MAKVSHKNHKDIRIGTLASASSGVKYLEQIIPHGFESFQLTFWQTLAGINLKSFAKSVNALFDCCDASARPVISSLGVFGNPLIDAKNRKAWESAIDNAHLFGCDIVAGFAGALPGKSVPDAMPTFKKVFGALAKRANWAGFPGFTAAVGGHVDGRAFGGTARVSADGTVALDIDEKHAVEWVEDQLGSMVLHRRAPTKKRARPVLRFADQDEEHPLGRLLTFVGGAMASSYRVRDGEITVVNRAIGPQHMTITVLGNQPNAEGKSLPRSYSVQYWDGKTGKLLRTQSIQNRWTRVGRFDLPTRLTVTTASQTGLNVRSLKLAKHKLLVKAAP